MDDRSAGPLISLSNEIATLAEALRLATVRADLAEAQADRQRGHILALTLDLADAHFRGILADARNAVADAQVIVADARIVVLEAAAAEWIAWGTA